MGQVQAFTARLTVDVHGADFLEQQEVLRGHSRPFLLTLTGPGMDELQLRWEALLLLRIIKASRPCPCLLAPRGSGS